MQERILKKILFLWSILLFSAVMLAACGKEESEEIQEKVFGIDYSEELEIPLIGQVVCGQEGTWIITTMKNDFIYGLAYNTSGNGMEKIEWQPKKGQYSIINIAERNGMFYAQMQNREDDTIEIYKYIAGDRWSHVMSVKTEDKEMYSVVGSGFFVDESGNAYLVSEDKVMRFDKDGQQTGVYELRGDICFFQENREGHVECVTADTNELTLYEFVESGAEEKWTLETADGQVHGIRSSEEGMLCLATNTELLFLDRESGSLLAKTDLVKMGVASVLAGYYDAEEGTLRLYGSAGNGAERLNYSLLSEKDAYAEQRTEIVYGMVGGANADTASSIWTAINTFNQENQDYYVTIRNYGGILNIDRLHADMAAGNGPDIIDMTYSEYYEAYVKNGYLENLLPYLESSQYRDDIIWNVLDTYMIEGGLYMLVPQFGLEGVLIHPEYETFVEEWDMKTFLELIEHNQWNKDIFGGQVGNPEMLLYYMLCGRQDEFIDWEQKTAAFETEGFMDMLALCMEYAQADWSDALEWTYEEFRWNTLCKREGFGLGFPSYLFNIDIYGREYPVYGYPTLSGQTYGITACADSCAIYAGSRQKQGAWEFIESLLWDSNQKYHGIVNPGFPIRSSVLKEKAEESKSENVKINEELVTLTEREISIMEDIIYNEKLSSVLIDPDIWAVIQEETAYYFAGDKSAQETAHIVQSRVHIILEE